MTNLDNSLQDYVNLAAEAQAAIAELVEAAIPDMKLSDVIDAKQWPTPEEYEKMVWAVTWYDNQIRNNLIKAGVLNG